MQDIEEHVLVGQVAGVYGVKGWVKVLSYTRPMENILNYSPWYLQVGGKRIATALLEGKKHGKGLIASLADIHDREQAGTLIGSDIYIERRQLPSLEEGQYYWQDLLGLEVINEQTVSLGRVTEILETGANDVLVVEDDKRRLIPWVMGRYVKAIDLEGGTIKVDWSAEYD